MGKGSLPPGFRFHPTDEELVKYYLKRKVLGKKLHPPAIAEVDIYKYAPWDLPDKSWLRTGDLKWYFFCPREKKYSSGARAKRATDIGYWKTTGNDRSVRYRNEVVGMKRTLVFHTGKPPKGDRTDWVMYEYRLTEKDLADRGVAQDAYVVSVIFKKDGPGPNNGAQYGAPFNEEDWEDDDDDEEVNVQEAIFPAAMAAPLFKLPTNQNMSIATTSHVQESRCTEPPIPCPSQTLPSASVLCPMGSVNDATSTEPPQVVHMEEVNGGEAVSSAGMLAPAFHVPYNRNSPTFASSSSFMPENMGYPAYITSIEASQAEAMNSDDDILSLLAMFGNGNNEIVLDDNLDIFNGLGDISKLTELTEARDNSRCLDARNIMDPVFPDQIFRDDVLELNDLIDPLGSSMDPTHHSSDGP